MNIKDNKKMYIGIVIALIVLFVISVISIIVYRNTQIKNFIEKRRI